MPAHRKPFEFIDNPYLSKKSLLPEEWDFGTCPEDQKEKCCFYEFARESTRICQEIEGRRDNNDWAMPCADPSASHYYRESWRLKFFHLFSHFPAIPWLKIPVKTRIAHCRELEEFEGPFMSIGFERLLDKDGEYEEFPMDDDYGILGITSVHAIEIDWTASNTALLKSFEKWLTRKRPSGNLMMENRGAKDAFEKLKLLGAYRLLRAFDGDCFKVIDYVHRIPKKTDQAPSYREDSSWRRAALDAASIIKGEAIPSSASTKIAKAIKIAAKSEIDARSAHVRLMHMTKMELREAAKLKGAELMAKLLAQYGKASPEANA